MNMDSVTYAYISEPVEFRQLEGKAIDFRKTFDVRGRGADEMLQLYLRKAHLSDDVEHMPAMQRRAYVYDIIRSNKSPGYWVPPCMQVSNDVFAQPPPAVLPPPTIKASPGSERHYFAEVASLSTMSQSSSSNSLSSLPGPSFATSVVVSNKGSKYEISGPVDFHHVSGDVTRDRTRNAFDLGAGANDNVLKKYMMERGIEEKDVAGIRKQELIKKIVHSNFTWMPNKQDMQKSEPKLVYATISTNNQITPPPSPPPPAVAPAAPIYSNYASLTNRFVDISDMDTPISRQQESQREVGTVIPVQVQANRQKIPPPPSAVMAANTHPTYPAAIEVRATPKTIKTQNEMYATIAPQTQRKVGTMRVAPPAPPKPTIVPSENRTTHHQYAAPMTVKTTPVQPQVAPMPVSTPVQPRMAPAQVSPPHKTTPMPPRMAPAQVAQKPKASTGVPPPPPPPPPVASGGGPPLPPPPPPAMGGPIPPPPPPMGGAALPMATKKSEQPKVVAAGGGGDNRDAFLESIRMGVSLKKVDKKAATISGIKPRAEKKPVQMDFMSELKLGITLRRVKNPADNPYSDANAKPDESQA